MLERIIDSITRASLRFKWVTIALSVILLVAGAFAFTQFNQELLPSIEFPQTVVVILNPGLDTADLLVDVTIPIEEAIQDIDGVVNIESTTSSFAVIIIVRNEFGADQEALREEIQAAVDTVDLPADIEPAQLLSFGFEDIPVAQLSVSSSKMTLAELKALVEADVIPALEEVDEVADVFAGGGQELPTEPPPTEEPTPEPTAAPTAVPTEDAGEGDGESTGVPLPQLWIDMAASQGITIATTDDLTSGFITAISSLAPFMLEELTPEMLLAMPLDALDALTTAAPDYVASLDAEVQAQIAERLAGYEGPEEIDPELAASAPALSGFWLEPPPEDSPMSFQFETAADLMNNEFGISAADLLNFYGNSGGPESATALGDLTPDVILWLAENEEGFLENLAPGTLRLFSPEVLSALPEDFLATLDPEFRAELEGIAAGTVEVFLPSTTINRTNGDPSLSLAVYKVGEANTVSVSHAVFEKMEELEETFSAQGLTFEVAFEQASFIEESINGVSREGGLGAVFAIIVILVFLSGRVKNKYTLSWRSTLVTAVSIPLSVFMAFAFLKWGAPLINALLNPIAQAVSGVAFLGAFMRSTVRLFPENFTLNIMTLSGMTVAIGRVVDDSIVVLENIYRWIQRGEDQREAVLVGTRDVAIAILASTVTTVVVFLPIGFLGGIVGEFFLPFGVAVTFALGSSFIVAVTIVPTLAFMFIRKEHLPPEGETWFQRLYTPILEWSLKNRLATLAIAAVLLLGSLYLMGTRPRALIPGFGEVTISASVELPSGTKMADTNDLTLEFEQALFEMEEVVVVQTSVGSGGGIESMMFGSGVNQARASITIGIENLDEADAVTAQVREQAESIFGEDNVVVSSGSMSSGAFGGFALVLSGDPDELAEVHDDIIAALNEVDGIANAESNLADADSIIRVDGQPAVRFTGELETEDALGVTQLAKDSIAEIAPDSITVSEGFETQMQTEGFTNAVRGIGISIIAVYLVMVLTFSSFVHPFTILFSLPLAVIGAAVALWLSDAVLGISALVGLMMLVGIVVTNAIVLLARVQSNRTRRGMDLHEALVEGGRTRLRPILMTAIAAMLALVPLSMGLTEGAIIASELGVVVIGGLFTSTMLTLLVVPVIYSLLDRFARNGKNKK